MNITHRPPSPRSALPRPGSPRPGFGPRIGIIALTLGILALTFALGCGANADSAPASENPAARPDRPQSADAPASDFRVRSELIFNTRADLSFQLGGEVGAVNVAVGDLVAAGDVLATLDSDTTTDLRHNETLAKVRVDQTEDALDRALGIESEDPLIRARAENALAQAEVAMEKAQDALDDYQLEHDEALGRARQRVADAIAALDKAEDAVTDFADAHGQQFANAVAARAQARTALDNAKDAVADFSPLHEESVKQLSARIAQTEVTLDQTRTTLRDFDRNHADRVSQATQNLARAETTLDNANDALDEFYVDIVNENFKNLPDGSNFDVVQLNSLQAAVDSAQRAVDYWEREITELAAGPKEIERQNLESRIAELETTLGILNDRLADRAAGPDQEELARLETQVLVAQERLNTAERNLAEVEQGVDQIELSRLETSVDSARVALDAARTRLERLEEGPDPTTLAALQQALTTARETRDDLARGPDPVAVALAQANLADALTDHADILDDLEDTVIRAPFSGLVRLVIIEPDDVIKVDARVIQLVDPADIAVRGLVETNYIERIDVGAPATVTLAAVPDVTFAAAVASVSQEARTERGVISFPVIFTVAIPEGVAIPPEPGLVTTTVTP